MSFLALGLLASRQQQGDTDGRQDKQDARSWNGAVGIGTASPAEILHAVGNIKATGHLMLGGYAADPYPFAGDRGGGHGGSGPGLSQSCALFGGLPGPGHRVFPEKSQS